MNEILKRTFCFVIALAVGSMSHSGEPAERSGFKSVCSAETPEGPLESVVYFVGEKAIEPEGDGAATVYDLSAMSWDDAGLGATVTLAQAEAWGQASIERTRQSVESRPEGPARDFALHMVDLGSRSPSRTGRSCSRILS